MMQFIMQAKPFKTKTHGVGKFSMIGDPWVVECGRAQDSGPRLARASQIAMMCYTSRHTDTFIQLPDPEKACQAAAQVSANGGNLQEGR